ncbi:hypothetical protein QBC34DRAFT_358588 [Podospora aff. communis PSN243]|uniref:DUF6603 domain-containing protein n=1 Tax=Podospora aff. communis PSN243 TaxID=3040156 RepID=A0AAV9GB14_9PEZI|nr:hypothetical protein QBC34DRAFT_358588 [Podospora aff. communis PSN243]
MDGMKDEKKEGKEKEEEKEKEKEGGGSDVELLVTPHRLGAMADTAVTPEGDAAINSMLESRLAQLKNALHKMYTTTCLDGLDMSTQEKPDWVHVLGQPKSNPVLLWFSEAMFAASLTFRGPIPVSDAPGEKPMYIDIHTTEVRLEVPRVGGSTQSPWSLLFSTSQQAFESQFGHESLVFPSARTEKTANKEPKAHHPTWTGEELQNGMTDFIMGQVFSLDLSNPNTENSGPESVKDLVQFLEAFDNCPTWLLEALNDVPLRLDVSPGARSFMTYCPDAQGWIGARLQLTMGDVRESNSWLGALVQHALWDNLQLKEAKVIGAKGVTKSHHVDQAPQANIVSTMFIRASLFGAVPGQTNERELDLALGVHAGGYMLMLQFSADDHAPPLLVHLMDWFNTKFKDNVPFPTDLASVLNAAVETVSKVVTPRQVVIMLGRDNSFESLRVDLEADMSFGAESGKSVPFLLTLQWWTSGRVEISGSLWDRFLPGVLEPKAMTPPMLDVFREDFLELGPRTDNSQDYVSLPHIIPGQDIAHLLPGVPKEITEARVDVIYDLGVTTMSVAGRLQCERQPSKSEIPPLWLDELDLLFSHEFGDSPQSKLLLRGTVMLAPRVTSDVDPISLKVEVSYLSGWTIVASLANVKFAHIYELFDSDGQQDAVQNFLEHVSIPSIDVKYAFSEGQPTRLDVAGTLLLGPVELELKYRHFGMKNGASDWRIDASLKPGEAVEVEIGSLTIGELLADINRGSTDLLPSFIADMSLPVDELGISLTCTKSVSPGKETMVVFCLEARFSDFHFSFVQIQDHKTLEGADGQLDAPPTRMLRVALTGLPRVPSMPIIDALEQPFDQLDFIWLSQDLTRGELQVLNSIFYDQKGETLYFTDTTDPSKRSDEDKLGAAGCHFQVVVKENGQPHLVMDHLFSRQSPSPASAASEDAAEEGDGGGEGNTTAAPPKEGTSGNGNTTTAPVSKSFGSLSVRDISLSMAANKLSMSLSASATLGPLAFDVMGLTLALDFSRLKSMSDLTDLSKGIISVSVSGLALLYAEPPVTLAGMLKQVSTTEAEGYAGGVIMAVDPYTFCAAGAYEKMHVGKAAFKTVFVFAKLVGPLIELEFAELSGVTGGFGYNSALRLPTTAAELPSFPFLSIGTGPVSTAGSSTTPMDQLRALIGVNDVDAGQPGSTSAPWIYPKNNSVWVTFGLSATALQCLTVQALVSVSLSSTPVFGLLATAVATMPPDSPPQEAILLAELYVGAVINPSAGLLVAVGALSPRSFVFSSSCHLTGGFALSSWFSGSAYAGDWVLTVGGWHPSYVPPAHYPATPARVGISWAYDDDLYIRGEAYFAITPHICMAGGRLDVVLDKGDLGARFSAWADFLIKYKPFYFLANVGVEIAVSLVLHLLFWKKTIRASLGADLELWGPPIGGVAHVSLWFIHFSVHFGPGLKARAALSLPEFDGEVRKALEKEEPEAERKDFVLAVTAGMVPRRQGKTEAEVGVEVKQAEAWVVRATTFEFEVHARYPISTVTTNTSDPGILTHDPLHFKLMEKPEETWTTAVNVTVRRTDAGHEHDSIGDLGSDNGFRQEPIVKQVPAALWTIYDAKEDPLTGSKTALRGDAKRTVPHVMGLKMMARHPGRSPDQLQPINPKEFGILDVFGADEGEGAKPDPFLPSVGEAREEFTAQKDDPQHSREEKIDRVKGFVTDEFAIKRRDRALDIYQDLYGGEKLSDRRPPTRFLRRLKREWRVAPSLSQIPQLDLVSRPRVMA